MSTWLSNARRRGRRSTKARREERQRSIGSTWSAGRAATTSDRPGETRRGADAVYDEQVVDGESPVTRKFSYAGPHPDRPSAGVVRGPSCLGGSTVRETLLCGGRCVPTSTQSEASWAAGCGFSPPPPPVYGDRRSFPAAGPFERNEHFSGAVQPSWDRRRWSTAQSNGLVGCAHGRAQPIYTPMLTAGPYDWNNVAQTSMQPGHDHRWRFPCVLSAWSGYLRRPQESVEAELLDPWNRSVGPFDRPIADMRRVESHTAFNYGLYSDPIRPDFNVSNMSGSEITHVDADFYRYSYPELVKCINPVAEADGGRRTPTYEAELENPIDGEVTGDLSTTTTLADGPTPRCCPNLISAMDPMSSDDSAGSFAETIHVVAESSTMIERFEWTVVAEMMSAMTTTTGRSPSGSDGTSWIQRGREEEEGSASAEVIEAAALLVEMSSVRGSRTGGEGVRERGTGGEGVKERVTAEEGVKERATTSGDDL